MRASVFDALEAGVPLVAGGVVDRVHVERAGAHPRAHSVNERLSRRAHARWLTGAACEHHLDIGTSPGDGEGNRGGREHRCQRNTYKSNDQMHAHVSYSSSFRA